MSQCIKGGPFFVSSAPDYVALVQKVSGAFVVDMRLGVQPCEPSRPREPQQTFFAALLDDALEPLDFSKAKEAAAPTAPTTPRVTKPKRTYRRRSAC